ncbi:uncharacterized protein LOC116993936 isoform X1 [Catharus ustulatus]|uniref:uncharacterized protein LOC116993936 isoform X1 n=1 Tax=Catharus ustulatus TaxID=91951 RepID=UPI00140D3B36|nr:uncharacterized protein LOC116993936 isoform X1 [Catharus ustulatus]
MQLLGQLRPGLPLLLGLCVASLLPGPLRARSCPARSGTRLPLPAQHGQQPGPGTGSASLWALQGHCCTFLALSLLLATLCLGCSLRRKAPRQQREVRDGDRQVAWCQGPGATACRVRSASPCAEESLGRHQGSSASSQPRARAQRQRWVPLLPGGNKDRLSHQNKTEPARGLLHTPCSLGQPRQAVDSPGEPEGAQPRAAPLPLSPSCLPCVSQQKVWTRPAWPRRCCLADCSPLSGEVIEVLGRQQENSASSRSFLRHLRQRCLRRDALQTARNSEVWKDLDEEAALFSS